MGKILKFTDLIAWQEAHKLALNIYKITKNFPKDEIFILVSQIKRAAISISSNIAEGFSRQWNKEKIQFYKIALGSLTEVENQLILAKDLAYIEKNEFNLLVEHLTTIQKLINGLVKSIKSRESI